MKIAYILDSVARVGGTERIMTEKMSYMADKLGYEVHLITYQQGAHPLPFPLSPRVKHTDLGCRFVELYKHNALLRIVKTISLKRRLYKRIATTISTIKPDVIVTTTYSDTDMKAMNRCKTAAMKTIESHVSFENTTDGHTFEKARMRRTLREVALCDVLITLTVEDAAAWQSSLSRARTGHGVPRIATIPNIISHYPESVTYKAGARRAIAVGRLHRQKGFDILIDAWGSINAKHPDWALDIYGSGPERAALEAQIAQQGMQASITIHDPVQDIFRKYAESSLFLLSSRYEGFGLVLLEAMAAGLPVVAFDCPFGPEMILGQGHPCLIENGNTQAFAERINAIIEDEQERKTLSNDSRKRAKQYTPEEVMPRWDALYKEGREG